MAMTLRLDDQQTNALKQVAAAEGRSMQQTVVRAIEVYLELHGRADRVAVLARQAAVDYPETLRRLGE